MSAVVTHSSGNHAQAVSLAARLCGVPAHIVMQRQPKVKVQAVQGYRGLLPSQTIMNRSVIHTHTHTHTHLSISLWM